MWLVGMLINIHSDHILRTLRKPGETGYKIPRGTYENAEFILKPLRTMPCFSFTDLETKVEYGLAVVRSLGRFINSNRCDDYFIRMLKAPILANRMVIKQKGSCG